MFHSKNYLFPASLLALMPHVSSADHGRDFIILQDAHVAAPLSGSLYQNFEWTDQGQDELALESGVLLGVVDRISAGANLRFADEGDGWNYSSIMPQILVDLSTPNCPIKFALQAGYEFAEESSHEESESHHEHDEGHDAAGEHEEHEETSEDHHEEEAGHSHTGIHIHGQSALRLTLIAEADLTDSDKLLFNLINVTPESGDSVWGYAAGYRHRFTDAVALGMEATGDFGEANEHIVLVGGYFSPIHDLTFKAGVGFGLTDESPDLTVRAGAVWRF